MNRRPPAPATPACMAPGGNRGLLLWAGAFCAAFSLAGCVPPTVDDRPVAVPTYQRLVERYNANLYGLDRLWCSTVVELWWSDQQGKAHYHQGNGHLIELLPDRLALSVTKVQTIFWLGCDQQRYWLLDLRDRADRKAYVGRHDLRGTTTSAPELALPIEARQLPWLLGLVQLDPQPLTEAAPAVRYERGLFVIEPPQKSARIGIDPATALPVSVALLDGDGKTVVEATLAEVGRVERGQAARSTWPRIRRRIDVRLPDDAGRLHLHLSRMTDARGPDHERKAQAFDTAFDFEILADRCVAEPVDLDHPAQQDD